MSTYFPSSHDITRKWFVLDASGKTLGRLATEAASTLAGKKNPKYTPFIDVGDHVIVVNAEKIVLTGLKSQQKLYRRYTGFPGGLREESFVRLMARRPEKIVEDAIKGMLPKSKMGRQMATKLKVYRGDKHHRGLEDAVRQAEERADYPLIDVGTDPARSPYLRRATDDGRATATGVIPLLLGGTGINVYKAVYRDGASTATEADRRRAFLRLG